MLYTCFEIIWQVMKNTKIITPKKCFILVNFSWIIRCKLKHCCRAILTGSTRSLEQKKQTHLRTLMVFTRKPIWNTGLASSIWPKCPGHSEMFPAHVWHLADLSMVPWRGSMRPPNLGRPPSVTSEYLIPPSVTDMRLYNSNT